MSKRLTTQEFIDRATTKHGSLYSYSDVVYIDIKCNVSIKCHLHGNFFQAPSAHLSGHGCPSCSGNKKLTTKKFIDKAIERHGYKYDYSKSTYTNSTSKIIIICKTHGFFEQTPGAHMNYKQGCPSCSGNKRLTTQEFIKKATNVHGDFYDYSGVVYINSKRKVSIKCHLHGEFFQKPDHHLHGHRCPECGLEKISKLKSENPPGWAYGEWEKAANKSKSFDSFKIYLIKCLGNGEVFYKIGKTFTAINKRFKSSKMPYNFKVLETITGDAYQISELERLIQDENKKYRYNPNLKFSGMHECFSNPPQKPLSEYQKQLLQIN